MLTPPFLPKCFILKLRIVHHASLSFNSGDPLWRPSTPRCFLPASEVHDMLTHVSHRSMAINYFNSSGFRSFNLYPLTFSQSGFTQSRRSFDTFLSQIDGHDLLQEFSTRMTPLSFEVAISRNGRFVDTCLQMMDKSNEIRLFDLQEFLFNTSHFLPE
jgi:hypothetical protein